MTVVRNIICITAITAIHLVILRGISLTKQNNPPPQVLSVSLLGSMITQADTPQSAAEEMSSPVSAVVAESSEPQPAVLPEPVIQPPVLQDANTSLSLQPKISATPEAIRDTNLTRSKPETFSKSKTKATHKLPQTAKTASAPTRAGSNSRQGNSSDQNVTAPSSSASYLNNSSPVYPPLSRKLKEEGRVTLRVLVDIQGKAKSVEVKHSSSFSRLDQAALHAVRRWRFVPAKRGSVPIEMWYELPIKFSLTN